MGLYRKIFGDNGEKIAEKHLERLGYRIVERNYRCRYGEIDLIARDGDTLVFVEVKTRSSTGFGTPGQSVDYRKQRHMIRTSLAYMNEKDLHEVEARFDVVSIVRTPEKTETEVIKDAFTADDLDNP